MKYKTLSLHIKSLSGHTNKESHSKNLGDIYTVHHEDVMLSFWWYGGSMVTHVESPFIGQHSLSAPARTNQTGWKYSSQTEDFLISHYPHFYLLTSTVWEPILDTADMGWKWYQYCTPLHAFREVNSLKISMSEIKYIPVSLVLPQSGININICWGCFRTKTVNSSGWGTSTLTLLLLPLLVEQ